MAFAASRLPGGEPVVTSPASAGTLRVGYQTAGWLYYQEQGRPAGQVVTTINQAADRAGIVIDWVYTDQDAAAALRTGLVDIWPMLIRTPGRDDLYYTEPWGKARHVLFHQNPALDRPEGRAAFRGVVAARQLDHMPALLARHFPHAEFHYFPSSTKAEEALCQQKAAAVVSIQPFAGSHNWDPVCRDATWLSLPEADLDIGLAARPSDPAAQAAARKLRRAIAELARQGELRGTAQAGQGFEADVRGLQRLLDLQRQERLLGAALGVMAALLAGILALATVVDGQRRRVRQALQLSEEAGRARAEATAELVQQRASLEKTNQQLREANQALIEAKNQADAAAAFRKQFLATMSHEIRTPLNGMLGMVTILDGLVQGAVERDCLRTLAISGQSLLQIVNDILDLSKLEAGQFQLRREPVSLRDRLENVLSIVHGAAAANGNEIGSVLDQDVPESIFGDPARIQQILVNLTGNAAKFTKNGKILLQVRAVAGEMVEFAVTDTGIGISEELQARLFRPFVQADRQAMDVAGTGLGLAICWHLVQLMGGEIGVESQLGRGSRFWFRIPLHVERDRPAEAPLAGRRVRLSAQSTLAQQTLTWQLVRMGATVLDGHSGAEADAAIASSLEEARLLRERIRGPILILQETLGGAPLPECGEFSTVPYPVRSAALHALNPAGKLETVPDQPSGRHDRQRILVVEDNPVNQKVVRLLLERLGYEACVVSNGHQALEEIQKADYPIVLMDCMMPEMDGWEATRRIREWEGGELTHWIIALTANAFEDDRERCRQAGMNDFVAKPIRIEDLERALRGAMIPLVIQQ